METTTATIKFTKEEVNLLINNIDFMLSLNIPIEEEWLKPYHKLKEDLLKISKEIVEGEHLNEVNTNRTSI
tara:strand:- start:254 stop:466 length:213 start_codon:yes stop_codon:yes gene_type:complete